MKKIFTIAIIAVFASTAIFTSCGKYEDGPGISLRSKKSRVAAEWEYEEMIVDGKDEDISGYKDLTITFEKDGSGEISFDGSTMDIEWEFGDKKESFKSRPKGESEWDEADILRLTEKEFWTIEKVDGVETEIHLKKK